MIKAMAPSPILVITSQVVRGRVGARATAFALERLGYPVWLVPTIILPWHPGHGKATRLVAGKEAFEALIDDLARAPWLPELGAVLTGYLGSPEQVKPIAQLITTIRAQNRNLLYCCDPVIGDKDGLYVPEETAIAIRDQLLPLANLATPNRFEFDWLTGQHHASNEEMIKTAKTLPVKQMAITSAFAMMRASQANLLIEGASDQAYLAEHRAFDHVPNGSGDLFAGLLTARLLQGLPIEKALAISTAGVFDILARTVAAEADELHLIEEQERLAHPMANITLRQIGARAATGKAQALKPTPLV